MDVDSCPRIVKGVRWNKEEEKGFLFNPFTGKYYEISLSAALLMELADGKTPILKIADTILNKHETDFDRETVITKVLEYYEDMIEEGVIEILPAESGGE